MSIYRRALKLNGEDRQVNQAIEECAEFTVAACHRRRGRHRDIYKFAEEIADVEVMMKQMRILTPRGLVDQIKREKLARLSKRLDRKEQKAALIAKRMYLSIYRTHRAISIATRMPERMLFGKATSKVKSTK